jgi:hypothetical protein
MLSALFRKIVVATAVRYNFGGCPGNALHSLHTPISLCDGVNNGVVYMYVQDYYLPFVISWVRLCGKFIMLK